MQMQSSSHFTTTVIQMLSFYPRDVGIKYTGMEKIGDFRWISLFTSETVRDRPMVTMEVNRKSWVPD